jgi:predicted O-linked N-acetylglucosamine transferase (SPINDLY family)
VPPIIASRAQIAADRARAEAALAAWEASGPVLSAPEKDLDFTAFAFSYHGIGNRDLFGRIGRAVAAACPALTAVAPHCQGGPRRAGRIRVGFLSAFFHRHSIGRTTRGLLAGLDRRHFEVCALFIAPLVDDEVSRAIHASADRAALLPRNLARAREMIAAQELDVLFYQDIGLDPFTTLLAHARLAPVQCVSFGHPDTTGIPTMDAFVSSDLFEPPGAQADYTEALVQLHDLGTLAYYQRPQVPAHPTPRAQLPLPAQGRLYLCPQALFKLHPDFDDLAAGILRADADGHLVLIAQGPRAWAELTRQRLARTAPDVMERVHFIPPQAGADYFSVLAAADVVLDTVRFNGMNTSLDALAVGTPVVTLPGALQRGRHTFGMYTRMGLPDCIAADAAGYVSLATRLAREPDLRRDVVRRIAERRDVLFEDRQVIAQFARFFESAVTAGPPRRPEIAA